MIGEAIQPENLTCLAGASNDQRFVSGAVSPF